MRAALVVSGITLGILLLLFLQVALPYLMGSVGLLVVGIVDAVLYLELRHRRAERKRARTGNRVPGGPGDRRSVKRPFPDEIGVAIALVVFVIGLCVEGVALQPDTGSSRANLFVFVLGITITTVGYVILRAYGWRYGVWTQYDWTSESEKFDTTEDH